MDISLFFFAIFLSKIANSMNVKITLCIWSTFRCNLNISKKNFVLKLRTSFEDCAALVVFAFWVHPSFHIFQRRFFLKHFYFWAFTFLHIFNLLYTCCIHVVKSCFSFWSYNCGLKSTLVSPLYCIWSETKTIRLKCWLSTIIWSCSVHIRCTM